MLSTGKNTLAGYLKFISRRRGQFALERVGTFELHLKCKLKESIIDGDGQFFLAYRTTGEGIIDRAPIVHSISPGNIRTHLSQIEPLKGRFILNGHSPCSGEVGGGCGLRIDGGGLGVDGDAAEE